MRWIPVTVEINKDNVDHQPWEGLRNKWITVIHSMNPLNKSLKSVPNTSTHNRLELTIQAQWAEWRILRQQKNYITNPDNCHVSVLAQQLTQDSNTKPQSIGFQTSKTYFVHKFQDSNKIHIRIQAMHIWHLAFQHVDWRSMAHSTTFLTSHYWNRMLGLFTPITVVHIFIRKPSKHFHKLTRSSKFLETSS